MFVRTDQREKVGEPWRRLTDLRSLGLDVGQCANEHGKCLTTGERRCRGQYGVEVGIAGGGGDGLSGGVVVGQKICFVHTDMGSSLLVCEVKYRSVTATRPTRRRTSNGSTPSSTKWRNNSAPAPCSLSDAYQTPGSPVWW